MSESCFEACRRTGVSDCDNSSFAAYLRVALPSAVLMWAEWWAYEAMSLLAGATLELTLLCEEALLCTANKHVQKTILQSS